MRFLYLHGYQGQAHEDKLAVLSAYAETIIAPNDYYLEANYFNRLQETIDAQQIDFLIGNSFGGLNAYYLSNFKQIPCLLFNPVPPSEAGMFAEYLQVENNAPPFADKTIVVGLQDEVISPQESIAYFSARPEQFRQLILVSNLGHRVNLQHFEQICTMMFK